jgi:hypothetical protein
VTIREGTVAQRGSRERWIRLRIWRNAAKGKGRRDLRHLRHRVTAFRSVEVIRECLRRGLSSNEYDIFLIRSQSTEPEELDYPSAWYEA